MEKNVPESMLREKMEAVPDEADRVIWAQSVEDAVEYLQNTEGKILITTGSKELIKYTKLTEYKERCFCESPLYGAGGYGVGRAWF